MFRSNRTRDYRKPRQAWAVGATVNVGFVTGLLVVEKVATPGDYRPDAYVLHQGSTNRWYRFTPHCGLERAASRQEAAQ